MITFARKSAYTTARWISLFAITILMTGLLQVLTLKPVFADDAYPWAGATYVDANYDWGYSTCPSSDSGCMSLYGYLNGVKMGEADPWVYYLRNCTSYVAWQINQQFSKDIHGWGNAASWATNAAGTYSVYTPSSYTPVKGDIAQWGTEVGGGFGHVSYVYAVNSGVASLDEYNVAGTGVFSSNRTTASGSAGTPDHYIHIGTVSSTTGTATSSQVINGVEHIFVGDSAGAIQDISWGNGAPLTQWQPAGISSSISKMTSQVTNGVITVVFASGVNLYSLSWGNGVQPSVTGEGSFASNITALSSRVTSDGAIHAYVGAGSQVWNVSWGNGTAYNKTLLTSEGAVVNALSNQVTSDGYQNVYVGLNNGSIMHIYWLSNPSQAQQWQPGTIGAAVVGITSQLINGVTNIDAATATAVTNFVYGNGATFAQHQVGSVSGMTITALDSIMTSDGYQNAIAGTSTGAIEDIYWTDPAHASQWQPGAYPASVVGLTTQIISGVIQANGITSSVADNLSWGNGSNPFLYQVSSNL